jgi:hypothetical protein
MSKLKSLEKLEKDKTQTIHDDFMPSFKLEENCFES